MISIFDMIDSVMTRPRALWQVPARRLDPAGRGASRSLRTPRICVNSFSEQVNSGKQDAKEAIYTKEAGAVGYDRQGHASRHSVPQGISRSRRRVASRPRG
jgi:hypothetical protein